MYATPVVMFTCFSKNDRVESGTKGVAVLVVERDVGRLKVGKSANAARTATIRTTPARGMRRLIVR